MVDKNYCMSSFMAFRYTKDDDKEFYPGMQHKLFHEPEKTRIVYSAADIDRFIQSDFDGFLKKYQHKALLLSGGMDSAILAAYMPGCDAYTFRFEGGAFQSEELHRAETFAGEYGLKLHYVDISWENTVEKYVDAVMQARQTPVHSIEPQIMQAAVQAKQDGADMMIIGAASDDIFGGCDQLLSKDWKYEEFKKRFMYTLPEDVLVDPVDMDYAFAPWKRGEDDIDFVGFLDADSSETDLSFQNAFDAAELPVYDPYLPLAMGEPLDIERVRRGESKYLIRALFAMKYPNLPIPEKVAMPRPVDKYFKDWAGPKRPEFRKDLDMSRFTGNQKWQLYCLERFLNLYEK